MIQTLVFSSAIYVDSLVGATLPEPISTTLLTPSEKQVPLLKTSGKEAHYSFL